MTPEAELAATFELHRERLLAIATRVLGSRFDAEDVVQEAWVRLARQDAARIENLAAWLTTVVGRLCIDVLRGRTAKREISYEERATELVVTEDDAGPEDTFVEAESLGLALLTVLGSLRPDERLAFVLHDLFAMPFAEIGPIVGKSSDAAKVAASRARRKVQCAPRPSGIRQQQRSVVDAFLAAARDGDFGRLLEILDPDLTWEIQTSRGVTVKVGAGEVVRAVERGSGSRIVARRVLVNGEPGIMAWGANGRPLSVMACTVENGRMTAIVSVTDRARLVTIDIPAPSPEHSKEQRLPAHRSAQPDALQQAAE